MKKWLLVFCLFPLLSVGQTYRCVTDSLHQIKLATDIVYRLKFEQNQKQFLNFSLSKTATNDTNYIIPVVVHVIYHSSNASVENISDEQVQSQIDVLNEDYNAINENIMDVPTIWQPLIRNSKIKFVLANIDTNGNYTNGITRTATSISSAFSIFDNRIFSRVDGGDDVWNSSNYLNIWVCELENNILGFAAFPGTISNSDGVVINYKAFGRFKNTLAPYNFGRTATHEVGHWLNLMHIWGDDNGTCAMDDGISDTPKQANSNTRCPSFPKTDACTDTAPGIMFMNFMDYTDDHCMMFFTNRQVERMKLALATSRHSLANSNGWALPNINQNDISIDSIELPVTYSTNRCIQPKIKVRNNGNASVANITFNYAVSAGISKNYLWKDSIQPGETKEIILDEIAGDLGSNLLEVRILNNDFNHVNNYKSSSFRINSMTNFNCTISSSINVYPNPISNNDLINLYFTYSESQKASIKIYSNDGKMVYTNDFKFNPQDKLEIANLNLINGIYLLEFMGEINHDVKKFEVIKK
ncbi:MAG: M43 family zinc metalloprotease [Bacteroidota bacterium]